MGDFMGQRKKLLFEWVRAIQKDDTRSSARDEVPMERPIGCTRAMGNIPPIEPLDCRTQPKTREPDYCERQLDEYS
jgi:hypothetical protein